MSMDAAIVGAWRTTVTIPGGPPPFVNLTTFSGDGIVLNAFPTPSPAPPGANHKLEFFTTAVGSWHENDGKIALAFETLGVDENGTPIGSHAISATVTVGADGTEWNGPFTLTVLDTAGTQVASVSGSVSGARIAPG
ncbi:MAG TPA: hypothetical protein VFP05_13395 [Thermomicrobiales bacterium]|nr:hypothetical protein [Thermomicrobiales bacterium]